jgi:hypothetical protein
MIRRSTSGRPARPETLEAVTRLTPMALARTVLIRRQRRLLRAAGKQRGTPITP